MTGSEETQDVVRTSREAADSAEWYRTAGAALITTIAINVVAPRAPDIVEYFIIGRWRRREASAAAAITQKQLNMNWKGGYPKLPLQNRRQEKKPHHTVPLCGYTQA